MKKRKQVKKYYFSSIGEMVWIIASFIYCGWYFYYHFILSNPLFGDFAKVVQFLMVWAGGGAVVVTIIRFTEKPDYLEPPKFTRNDFFTLSIIAIVLYFGLT